MIQEGDIFYAYKWMSGGLSEEPERWTFESKDSLPDFSTSTANPDRKIYPKFKVTLGKLEPFIVPPCQHEGMPWSDKSHKGIFWKCSKCDVELKTPKWETV